MASTEVLRPKITSPTGTVDEAEVLSERSRTDTRQRLLRIALGAAGVWLATRFAYAVFSYFAVVLNHQGPSQARSLLQVWDQYDTHWFLLISRSGYFDPSAAAFFPLYPGLVGAISAMLGHAHGPIWPAFDGLRLGIALGVANLGALLGFVGLALLAAHEYGEERAASMPVLLAAAYPFAFFFAAAYTEGPFLAAAVFTLYFARRGAWRWAAAAAFVAGLTRSTAVVLVLPLAWEYGRQRGWWTRGGQRNLGAQRVLEALAVVGAAPVAIALFAAFLWQRFGTPTFWLTIQSTGWHRQAMAPWLTFARLGHRLLFFPPFSGSEAQLILNLLPLLLCLAVTAIACRQMPFAFILYTLGLCCLSISAPILGRDELIESAGRFLAVAIPVFLVLGRWLGTRQVLAQAWVSAGFMVQAVLLTAFFAGRWVG